MDRPPTPSAIGGVDAVIDRRERVANLLRDLMGAPSVLGATVITRDGLCVQNGDQGIVAPEAVSAMTAALMSAAETAFYALGGGRRIRVSAETEDKRLIALGISDQLLLVVLCRPHAGSPDPLPRVETAAQRIGQIMRGT